MITANVADVQDEFEGFLHKARFGPVFIQKAGRDVAVLLSKAKYDRLTNRQTRRPRRRGFAKHLFEGIDVDALLATPIPGFEE